MSGPSGSLTSSYYYEYEGFATRLSSSQVCASPSVKEKLKVFADVRRLLREAGFDPPLVHAANTSAVISHHESWNTMVRPGLAIYGYHLPFERAGRVVTGKGLRLTLKPMLT